MKFISFLLSYKKNETWGEIIILYFLASKHAFLSLLNQSAGAFPANIFTIAFGIFP